MNLLLHLGLSGEIELSVTGPTTHRLVPANVSSSIVMELGSGIAGTLSARGMNLAHAGRLAVQPLLFEQTNYEVDFVQPDLKDSEPIGLFIGGVDVLKGRHRRGHASAVLNFESEIGYSGWELRQSGRLLAALRLEVFPTKLDYRSDYFELRSSLEAEVRMLAAALSGRTLKPRGRRRTNQQPTDFEWLIQLRSLFAEWLMAIECIDRHPRRLLVRETQLRRTSQVRRADRTALHYLRRHPQQLSRAASGPLRIGGERWNTERIPDSRRQLDLETPENKFVAYAFHRISAKLRAIRSRLSSERPGANAWCDFLDEADRRMRRLEMRSILAELEVPQRLPPITLAMHLAPGYSEFLRTWVQLQATLTLDGEALELNEKNVATLYELWCFVALGNLLRRELDAKPRRPDWLVVDRLRVTLGLRKGRHSELHLDSTRYGSVRISYNRSENTPTGTCKPDNTLEIEQRTPTKRAFRYVFDAKYRLSDDEEYQKANWAPGVPPDVITKMHAYRDQIVSETLTTCAIDPAAFVWDLGQRNFVQQTVGAFALFPYAGADADKNRFFKSASIVGVGALPFLPSRRSEVEELIRRIIATTGETVEDTAVELSGEEEVVRIVKSHEYGLLGIVKSPAQLDYAIRERIYHMPYRAKQLRLRADFLILIVSATHAREQHGALYHAKVRSVNFGTRGSISPKPPGDEGARRASEPYIWFETEEWVRVNPVLTYKGHPPHFGFTTRLAFETASDVADLLLVREPERRLASELRATGAIVQAHDDTLTSASPFDLASLRVRLRATWPDSPRGTEIRFNPVAGEFHWDGGNATWKELMFSPAEVLLRIRAAAIAGSTVPSA